MISQLNADQGKIFSHIKSYVAKGQSYNLFIDGPAGCGKTYVLNAVITYYMSLGLEPIVVASSGVAASLLTDGATAHSTLQIPLSCQSDSLCPWNPKQFPSKTFLKAKVLIWDEISMAHKNGIEAVDRLL
jgi:ABC-type nitrate/sulfonate/bicarbonate transport system ATPase subunit